MERPVGEIFVYNGKTLEVVEGKMDDCNGCYFRGNGCGHEFVHLLRGRCHHRNDSKATIFKQIDIFKFLK